MLPRKISSRRLACCPRNGGETDILAGGTDLLSLMKERIHTPKRVVSLSSIDGLGGIESSADGLRIGATATLDDLLASGEVRSNYSALVHAAEGVSSPQIRAMGTVGGDLLQRPRCWYFRNGLGLLAKDSAGNSLVPNGENRYHAIFGNKGPAYFVNVFEPGAGAGCAWGYRNPGLG